MFRFISNILDDTWGRWQRKRFLDAWFKHIAECEGCTKITCCVACGRPPELKKRTLFT